MTSKCKSAFERARSVLIYQIVAGVHFATLEDGFADGDVIVRLGLILKWIVLAWLAAELAVFFLLVATIGLGLTLLLGFVTTACGFLLLGKASRDTLQQLNAQPQGGLTVILLGPARILAAVLLILPGFLSDLIGLVLAIPLFGQFFSTAVSRKYAPQRPDFVDLDATEWRQADENSSGPMALPKNTGASQPPV